MAGGGRLGLNITGSCGGQFKALQKWKPEKQQCILCVKIWSLCLRGLCVQVEVEEDICKV